MYGKTVRRVNAVVDVQVVELFYSAADAVNPPLLPTAPEGF